MFTQLRWVPYYTLTHFHQLPFWNPYKCGGMPMLGNPESAIVTPFLLLYLVFGLIPGMLLEIYLHVAIMFAGGYVFGRELGLVPRAALVLAAMFPSSSWLSLHVAMGHLNFLSIAYIPWILALLLDVMQIASMASRDTGRTALRADADGRQLRIRFCRDAGRDRVAVWYAVIQT